MIRRFAILAVAFAVAGVASVASADDAALIEKGKAVFESAKPPCKTCHNAKKNPLDNYGAAGTAENVKAWLRTPKEMFAKTGKKGAKPTFGPDKISDEDLDALAAYLASLKN